MKATDSRSEEDIFLITYDALATRESRRAWVAASLIKWKSPAIYESVRLNSSPKFWHAVADALAAIEGRDGPKKYFRLPTPTCLHVVESYWAALTFLSKQSFDNDEAITLSGEVESTIPTIGDIKQQFVRLFGEQSLPADWTIKKILTTRGLTWRKGKGGRPKKPAAK